LSALVVVRFVVSRCAGRVTSPRRQLAPLDVVVVVAMLDDLALAVEVQHRHTRVGEFLALLGPAGPPLDRSPLTRHDRLPKPALDILLGRKLLAQIAADASQTRFGSPNAGERYSTASAYRAAMASASRRGQARDQVSA
jgi:hypothetical protein